METARLRVETAKQFRDIPPIIRRVLRPMMERLVMSNNELQMMRSKYRSETLQRKLLYNKLQELRGNIRVFCRIRWDERLKQGGKILNVGDNTDVTLNDGKISKTYSFDRAFDVEASQEDVYSEAEPIITSCLDGYNVCIMAYGQTGSGQWLAKSSFVVFFYEAFFSRSRRHLISFNHHQFNFISFPLFLIQEKRLP
jgi:kinesin family protein C2/C3